MKKIKKWRIIKKKTLLDVPTRFTVDCQHVLLPDGRKINDYYKITFPKSVIIIARSKDGRIIMSHQYVHGPQKISYVLPGGKVEGKDSALHTAKRELLEETGYTSRSWKSLGAFVSHINYGCGIVHYFLAKDAVRTALPDARDLEEMNILLMTKQQIVQKIKEHKIISLGTIAAFTLYNAHEKNSLFTD